MSSILATRVCARCGEPKTEEEFYKRSNGTLDSYCKSCKKETSKQWRADWRERDLEEVRAYDRERARRYRVNNPESVHDNHLKRCHNITLEDYKKMLAEQGGVCALCKSPESGFKTGVFAVDHDHACCPGTKSCGKCVRGLLCNTCNVNLRAVELWDDEQIAAARRYLAQ